MKTVTTDFDKLYLEYSKTLVYYAYKIVNDRTLAEDIMQNVFYIALRKGILRKHENPGAWLYTAVRYEALFEYRKLIRECALSNQANREDQYEVINILETLKSILSDSEYELAEKYFLHGSTEKELASELGISENAVRIRIHKIRSKIRPALLTLLMIVWDMNG